MVEGPGTPGAGRRPRGSGFPVLTHPRWVITMDRTRLRAALTALFLGTPGGLAVALADEPALRRDLAAALAPPCWQPVVAGGGLAGAMGGMMPGRSVVQREWEAPATLAAARSLAR